MRFRLLLVLFGSVLVLAACVNDPAERDDETDDGVSVEQTPIDEEVEPTPTLTPEDAATTLPDEDPIDVYLEAHEAAQEQRYEVTFRLADFPEDASEAVIVIEEILLGPFGEDAPVYQDEHYPVAIEFRFPVDTTPDVLEELKY